MSQLQPLEMLKCKKSFLSLSVAQIQVQVQAQKTWFVEEALYWESSFKAEKSEK